ncbi:MerR family transcriptional regulator [Desulfuribacillus alkaliarsenatis]|uniref:Transcriptional regulator n=1 Tax=Desulfuribacillus alkaliarsenatis TaxID=766136 RepID=A0A1E5FZX1_9FIRM|nr:MerR family transcriptional regulator [Desulfuribacillus alkaliarsenatis]OEF95999.1 transcriptional regulator [Desulfuribacillus alkaliarsenatis]
MDNNERRKQPLFPIGIVKKLTSLSARQIRYYEEHKLIQPTRTEGNQRLFSFEDVDRLLEIKELIDQGVNIAGIKTVLGTIDGTPPVADIKEVEEKNDLSDKELHDLLQAHIQEHIAKPSMNNPLIQGQLHRFFRR